MVSIKAVCAGASDGPKEHTGKIELVAGKGVKGEEGDALVRIISFEDVRSFRRSGTLVKYGGFGENIILQGIDGDDLHEGMKLRCGEVVLSLTEIRSRDPLAPRQQDGLYIPGVMALATVEKGGTVADEGEVTLE